MTSKLGATIKLTTPQLRVLLDCLGRTAADAETYGTAYAYGQAQGIQDAKRAILRSLNLPDDWEREMNELEEYEVKMSLTSEERATQ